MVIQLKGKINMTDVSFVKFKKKHLFFVSYIDRIWKSQNIFFYFFSLLVVGDSYERF